MADTPENFQDAGEKALRDKIRRVRDARAGFALTLEYARTHGVDDEQIMAICAEEGLDFAGMRALLDGGA